MSTEYYQHRKGRIILSHAYVRVSNSETRERVLRRELLKTTRTAPSKRINSLYSYAGLCGCKNVKCKRIALKRFIQSKSEAL